VVVGYYPAEIWFLLKPWRHLYLPASSLQLAAPLKGEIRINLISHRNTPPNRGLESLHSHRATCKASSALSSSFWTCGSFMPLSSRLVCWP